MKIANSITAGITHRQMKLVRLKLLFILTNSFLILHKVFSAGQPPAVQGKKPCIK